MFPDLAEVSTNDRKKYVDQTSNGELGSAHHRSLVEVIGSKERERAVRDVVVSILKEWHSIEMEEWIELNNQNDIQKKEKLRLKEKLKKEEEKKHKLMDRAVMGSMFGDSFGDDSDEEEEGVYCVDTRRSLSIKEEDTTTTTTTPTTSSRPSSLHSSKNRSLSGGQSSKLLKMLGQEERNNAENGADHHQKRSSASSLGVISNVLDHARSSMGLGGANNSATKHDRTSSSNSNQSHHSQRSSGSDFFKSMLGMKGSTDAHVPKRQFTTIQEEGSAMGSSEKESNAEKEEAQMLLLERRWILIFENVQWSDDASIALIRSVCSDPRSPFLIVVTMRPPSQRDGAGNNNPNDGGSNKNDIASSNTQATTATTSTSTTTTTATTNTTTTTTSLEHHSSPLQHKYHLFQHLLQETSNTPESMNRQAEKIVLGTLTPKQVDSVVKHVMETNSVDPKLIKLLFKHVRGQPMFTIELVKHMKSKGIIVKMNTVSGLEYSNASSSSLIEKKTLSRHLSSGAQLFGGHLRQKSGASRLASFHTQKTKSNSSLNGSSFEDSFKGSNLEGEELYTATLKPGIDGNELELPDDIATLMTVRSKCIYVEILVDCVTILDCNYRQNYFD